MIVLFLTSELTAKAAGAPSPKPPDSSAAGKAAVSGGSTTSAQISNAATSPTKKMNSSSISIVYLVTSRWSLIAGRLPGRTDNEIKNYWNTHIRRKLLNRGIDPATHRPVTDQPNNVTTTATAPAPNLNVNSSPDGTTTTTISFASTTPASPITIHHLVKNEVEDDVKICSDSPDRRKIKNASPEKQERCPDLNLELRIGPPHHQNNAISSSNSYIPQHQQSVEYHRQTLVTGGRTSGGAIICFACSMGVQNSKECSCTTSLSGTSSNSSGYDFLGLKNVALDYRSLEMK
ncbi:hypothetical protein E3N88_31328 [Mikania micrantha]|uniref:Uncharacterized protein n=1 Tax=Mikania micrantha TaxID=192012 RepID=A0A5N6MS25_9ASTR|nr:hypothetical protein E3N88_31328 [Mikania micrantha]